MLIITRGISGSGKTTWAKEYVQAQAKAGNYYCMIVSRDDIRLANGYGLYAGRFEEVVNDIQENMISGGLAKKMTVIAADTNLRSKYVNNLVSIAEAFNVKWRIKDFDVDVEECIKRDLLRKPWVGEDAIRKQYIRWLNRKQYEGYLML